MARKGAEIVAAERRVKAVELRTSGLTYRQIGLELGVSHVQAFRDVMAGLKALHNECREKAAELAELEWERLESCERDLIRALRSTGKKGEKTPKLKPSDVCDIVDARRKLSESRRKLKGLDKPTKHEHSGTIDLSVNERRTRLLGLVDSLRQRAGAAGDRTPFDGLSGDN